MSDWQKGDLALCLTGKKRGGVFTVEAVVTYLGELGIVIEGWHSDHETRAFKASHFRKIRPSAIKHIEALKDVPLPVRENEHA